MREKLPVRAEILCLEVGVSPGLVKFFKFQETLRSPSKSSILPNKDILLILCVKGNVVSLLESS